MIDKSQKSKFGFKRETTMVNKDFKNDLTSDIMDYDEQIRAINKKN